MSHFTVMVRVPGVVERDGVEAAIEKLMAPFQENNMGDCPREYLEFEDEEDAARKEYEEEGCEMVELENGKHVYPWDERFRVPGSIGTGGGTHKVPETLKTVNVPHKERFGTFEYFMRSYHGSKARDPEKNRYGHWRNPNQKWDYWSIGGRWRGKLNTVAGKEDVARISDLDWASIERASALDAEKFYDEWVDFAAGKKFDPFDGPRDTALRIGLLECKDADELEEPVWRKIKWDRQLREGVDRFDVLKSATRDEIIALHKRMQHPLRTYAILDSRGWRSPGDMGWWGMSSDTPKTLMEFADHFADWISSGDRSDWIAVLDCHT